MNFDTWFNKQSTLIKVILLIIPVVGWICELLIRLSVMMKKTDLAHILVFVLFLFVGWGVILEIVDIVWLVLNGHLILGE